MQWFLLPAVALILTLPAKAGSKRTKVGWFVLGFLAAMAPWWIRNLMQFGEMSNPALMISTLHHGMYPDFMYAGRPETFGFPYRFDPRSPEITQSIGSVLVRNRSSLYRPNRRTSALVSDRKAADVLELGQQCARRWRRFYPPVHQNTICNQPATVSFSPSDALAALAAGRSRHAWQPALLATFARIETWSPRAAWAWRVSGALLLYFVVLHIVGAPFPRYSIPILPILYLQAAGTFAVAFRLIRPARS